MHFSKISKVHRTLLAKTQNFQLLSPGLHDLSSAETLGMKTRKYGKRNHKIRKRKSLQLLDISQQKYKSQVSKCSRTAVILTRENKEKLLVEQAPKFFKTFVSKTQHNHYSSEPIDNLEHSQHMHLFRFSTFELTSVSTLQQIRLFYSEI